MSMRQDLCYLGLHPALLRHKCSYFAQDSGWVLFLGLFLPELQITKAYALSIIYSLIGDNRWLKTLPALARHLHSNGAHAPSAQTQPLELPQPSGIPRQDRPEAPIFRRHPQSGLGQRRSPCRYHRACIQDQDLSAGTPGPLLYIPSVPSAQSAQWHISNLHLVLLMVLLGKTAGLERAVRHKSNRSWKRV